MDEKSLHRINLGLGLLTLSLFALIAFTVAGIDLGNARTRLKEQVDNRLTRFNLLLGNADASLAALTSLHQVSLGLNTTELTTFSQKVKEKSPYISTILQLPRVTDKDRSSVEKSMREDGFPLFHIMTPVQRERSIPEPKRKFYFPVTFVEPMTPDTARLVGLDAAAVPELRGTILRAARSGDISVSDPVRLLGKERLWVFDAVYQGYVIPTSEKERMEQLQGLSAIQIDPHMIISEMLPKEGGLYLSASLMDPKGHSARLFERPVPREGLLQAMLTPLSYHRTSAYHDKKFNFEFKRPVFWSDLHWALILELWFTVAMLMALVGHHMVQRLRAEQRDAANRREIRTLQERAHITLDSIGDAVITTDTNGTVQYLNPVAEHLTGWPLSRAHGRKLKEIVTFINEQDDSPIPCPVIKCLQDEEYREQGSHVLLRRNDEIDIPVDESVAPVRDGDGKVVGAVLVIRDVSVERHLTARITYQATHDALTGLGNRHHFEQELKHLLQRERHGDEEHVLLYLDLDQFKFVNDSVGHVAGDQLLRQLSSLIKAQVRKGDLIARLGGDEFGILLRHCPLEQAKEIAAKLCQQIAKHPFQWDDKLFTVSASIGVLSIDSGINTLTAAMSAVDSACFIAKELGRNRFYVYQPDDKEISRRELELQALQHIQYALRHGAFHLCLQPIVPAADNDGGYAMGEFLVRMRDRLGNPVPPLAFIPTAERYGMMKQIDQWVIRNALLRIAGDRRGELEPDRAPCEVYTINLSAQSLDDEEMSNFIIRTAEEIGVPPSAVCFEITETAAIANFEQALTMIETLRGRGFLFALDDFGTGLSSFAYLKKIPVDFLKIDGEFVRDMEEDAVDQAMVETINSVAHVLKLRTIAESVENANIQTILERMGVDYLQGYHLGHPQPVEIPPLVSHSLMAVGDR